MNLKGFEACDHPNTAETTADLASRVQGQLSGQVRELRLIPREGGLILRGRARCYYVKQLAQHAVMQSTQMPILANEIEVS